MKLKSNKIFEQLKQKFEVEEVEKIDIELPLKVKEILNEEIVETEYGITLKCWEHKFRASRINENNSIFEDNENHFHIDHFSENEKENEVFKLGVKTIYLLADKFKRKGYKNMEFSYSFHTKQMSKQFDVDKNLTIESQYFFGDRLSFNIIDPNKAIRADLETYLYNAMLTIEI